MSLRALVVSGIWPPDVGGPASHGPAVCRAWLARGGAVRACISAAAAPDPEAFPVTWTDRTRPLPVRMADGARLLLAEARHADVVYATGMYHRAAAACAASGTPLVIKLVNDPAYERARTTGSFDKTLEAFQDEPGTRGVRALRAARDRALAQADHLVVPSRYLAEIVATWGIGVPVTVIHNPAAVPRILEDRDALRAELGIHRPCAVFAGRFVAQKNLPMLLRAAARVPELDLVLIGAGPEQAAVEALIADLGLGGHVRTVSALPQVEVARWMRAADVSVLPSDWENFPHAVVEALEQGTPVIATAVGGVPEILTDGEDGRLIARGDEDGMVEALAEVVTRPELLDRRRAAVAEPTGRFAPRALLARTCDLLEEAGRGG